MAYLLPLGFNGESVKITKTEYETLADLRYSLRQFLHFSEEAAHNAGVTPQQHQALLAIKGFRENQSITIGELAERLQVRHHSAVGLVDRLVLKKFVVREHHPADRRQVFLALTERGENMLEKLSTAHKEQLRRIGPHIESLLKRLRG
jgi:DNA-binding MarR family transcriptional regulator